MKTVSESFVASARSLSLLLLSLTALFAHGADWYVSPTGNDKYDGSSSNAVSETVGPKLSFKSLMPSVKDGDTIWLLPGNHAPEAMNNGMTRLVVEVPNVKVKSLSGNPADTAIVGVFGTGIASNYTSSDAISCIRFSKDAANGIVEGITMRDATARWVNPTSNGNERGGGIYDLSMSCWAINCVFSNCCSYTGGAMKGGNAARCRFIDCTSPNGAAINDCRQMAFCLFQRCDCNGNGGRGMHNGPTLFVNCTVTGAERAFFADTSTALNTISIENYLSKSLDNGAISGATLYATNSIFGVFKNTHLDDFDVCLTNKTLVQVGFVSSSSGDWRISEGYAAATYGDARHLERIALPEGYEHRDLYGKLVATEGAIPAGCAPVRHPTRIVMDAGIASEGFNTGTNVIPYMTTGTATFTVDVPSLTRPYLGMNIDGVFHPLATSVTCDYPEDGETLTVALACGTNWYVNAATGSDAQGGGTPETAKATISAAATNAVAGDVIYVSPGAYGAAEGTHKSASNHSIGARVVLAENVALVAEDPKTTFIVGQSCTESPDEDNVYGNGPGAVRCVYLNAGASIRGFTLTGGHTRGTKTNVGGDANFRGGAVLGVDNATCRVIGCIVSNNAARVGPLYGVSLERCRVTENMGTLELAAGAAGASCRWYGCLIDGNRGSAPIRDPGFIDACTIGTKNVSLAGAGNTQVIWTDGGVAFPMANTVMLEGSFSAVPIATNCVFLSSMIGSRLLESNCTNCQFLSSVSAAKVDADYRPAAGSPLIDRGDAAVGFVAADGMDLAGNPRISNGALDVGAYEYDWRPAFGAALGRRVTVSSASAAVCLNSGRLQVPSGEVVATVGKEGAGIARFAITGTGTLAVYVNGTLADTFAAGDSEASLGDIAADAICRFVYVPGENDTGAAFLEALGVLSGMLLIVR